MGSNPGAVAPQSTTLTAGPLLLGHSTTNLSFKFMFLQIHNLIARETLTLVIKLGRRNFLLLFVT